LDVKIFYGSVELITSGIVHVVGDHLKMTIDGLPIDVFFLDDAHGPRWATDGADNRLELKLYNLNGLMPEGRIEPIPVASNERGDILLSFRVGVIDKARSLRVFEYSLFQEGSSDV